MDGFLEICGAVGIVGGAVAVIWRFISPYFKVKNNVNNNSEKIKRLQKSKKDEFKSLEEIRSLNRAQCNMMILMINHMIDGNNVQEMKETRRKLQDLLANIDK